MSRFTRALIPLSQRQTVDELNDALDLSYGDPGRKRSAFLIMLILSGIIAIAGVLADSTATVIGAMIIAPLATPILGIALGIVTGHLSLVLRSMLWVLIGVAIVVALGILFTYFIADPGSLETNSQVTGRTSPRIIDLVAALATGFAGAFAMCRRDLSAVLPGVAIAISLVPPLAVVGVCAGSGDGESAFGALLLFLSNVLALVISGSVVFTLAGYAREPSSVPTAKRRRAYVIVGALFLVVAIPLAVNTALSVAFAGWTATIHDDAEDWLSAAHGATVDAVEWSGFTAIVAVTTEDGLVPPPAELADALTGLPAFISVVVDAGIAQEHVIR